MFHPDMTMHGIQIFFKVLSIKRESKDSQIINAKHMKDFISHLAHYVNLLLANVMSKARSEESNSNDPRDRNNAF